MSRATAAAALLTLFVLAPSAPAAAQDEPLVSIELSRWQSHDGVERPYRFIVEMRASEPAEVVADRRLLYFEARVGRQRHRCRHPAAPARVSPGRVRMLRPDQDEEEALWREWIDLRMYCSGRALRALEGGAPLDVRYGWTRRGPSRWVARRPGTPSRTWISRLDAPAVDILPVEPTPTRQMGTTEESPLEVALAPATARTEAGLRFRVSVASRYGTHRVYVRPDAWVFRVSGPLGTVSCRPELGGGVPPPELFRRVTPRAPWRATLEASFFCPAGTFQLPGVYEVTPRVRLRQSGEEWGFSAITGTFQGPPAPVRVSVGEHAYLEQIPERGADAQE
jgi:hypothetical protein